MKAAGVVNDRRMKPGFAMVIRTGQGFHISSVIWFMMLREKLSRSA